MGFETMTLPRLASKLLSLNMGSTILLLYISTKNSKKKKMVLFYYKETCKQFNIILQPFAALFAVTKTFPKCRFIAIHK